MSVETRAQSTPGPWTVIESYGHKTVVIDQHDECVANTGDLVKDWSECEANARLISCAPELLALLRDVLANHEQTLRELRAAPRSGGLTLRLRAAIAKAEGRDQP